MQSTLVPSEQNPCLSGGVTVINATSSFMIFLLNMCGISLRNIGMQSALPSLTAFLALAARKKELERNIPEDLNKFVSQFIKTQHYYNKQ